MDWKEADFNTATASGPIQVSGWIAGPFGVHDNGIGWTVTHLQTGYSIPTGIECFCGFPTPDAAKEFALRILPVENWEEVTAENARGRKGVAKQLNVIAEDIFDALWAA